MSRPGVLIVGGLTACAFGPYLFDGASELSGFRTEQIAVYVTAVLLLIAGGWIRARPTPAGALVMGLLGLQFLLAAIGAASPPHNTTMYQFGSAAAGLDNLLLPMAVIGIVWMVLGAGARPAVLIDVVCRVVVWIMVVNVGLALWRASGHGPDLTAFQGPVGAHTVAGKAEQLGRYSGIFNQPAEAGVLYSVALLAAVHLYRLRPVLFAVVAIVITVGGFLTVSKIFLLIGLPIALWQIVRATGHRHRRLFAVLFAAVPLLLAVRVGVVRQWTGGQFLHRLVPGSGQSLVDLYTAGRFGSESTLAVVAGEVLRTSPLLGFGAGGLAVPYDNAWIESLVIGGLVGAVNLTAVLIVLGNACWNLRDRDADPSLTRFAGGLMAVVVGSAFGVPSLTANRCSTVLWLLLALMLLSERETGPDRRDRRPPGRPPRRAPGTRAGRPAGVPGPWSSPAASG